MAGTLLGMWLEGRLALGHVDIHIVSVTKGSEMAQKVRQAGYGATQVPAQGQSGPVHLIEVVAPRKQVAHLLRLVSEVDVTSFVTVTEARQVVHGYQRGLYPPLSASSISPSIPIWPSANGSPPAARHCQRWA